MGEPSALGATILGAHHSSLCIRVFVYAGASINKASQIQVLFYAKARVSKFSPDLADGMN